MHREDFPQLSDGFTYFDNAATTMKPVCVLDAMQKFYAEQNANPRRGFYATSVEATRLLANARKNIADFINADADEIFFTSGATAGLNMLALSLGGILGKSDIIAISKIEHHSNMLPWRKTGAEIKYFDPFEPVHFPVGAKIVAISAYSNVLGSIPNLAAIITEAHRVGAACVVDVTQAIAHMSIDFRALDADFLVFSGHKIYGPMGIGVVCGKKELLADLVPAFWGGEMVDGVDLNNETLTEIPERFEAGTVNVAGVIGLSEAIDYLQQIDHEKALQYESELGAYLYEQIQSLDNVELFSKGPSSIASFDVVGVHSHDVAQLLADNGIAVRAGYHCAQLALGVPSVRASLCFYNTKAEIDRLINQLSTVREKMHVR